MTLLRTLVIAAVICGLLLATALPALAAGPGTGRWWEGKVEVVRGQASVSTVSPPPGATGVINVNGKTIYVTANTTYKVPGLNTAGIGDIDGKYIVAQCDIAAATLWARHVVVVPGGSEGGELEYGYEHHTGSVMTYDYEPNKGGTISIEDRSSNLIPFQIHAGNLRIMPSGATVAVGKRVTVISYREEPGAQLFAVAVLVYSQRAPSLSHEGPSHEGWTEAQKAARDKERTVPER